VIALRRLHHRLDVLGGEAHEIRVAADEVRGDDLLHGDDGAAARGHGAVEILVERRRRDQVAGAVGRPGVDQRHVGHQRAHERHPALGAEGVVGHDEVAGARVVLLHRGAQQRARGQERHPHGAGEEPQGKGQHGPVGDLEPPLQHRARDQRLRRGERIALAHEGGDHPADEPPVNQRRPRRAQADGGEREVRPAAPPLADQLADEGIGATMGGAEIDGVPGAHVT
jgi:hypothetical protein